MSVLKFSNGKQHLFSVQINAVTKIPHRNEFVEFSGVKYVVREVLYQYKGSMLKQLESITVKLLEAK